MGTLCWGCKRICYPTTIRSCGQRECEGHKVAGPCPMQVGKKTCGYVEEPYPPCPPPKED